MAKVRISTTVEAQLLERARAAHGGRTDASLVESALQALLACYRDAEVDAAYRDAYARHPVDEPDAWGDLASWAEAARGSTGAR